MTRWLVVALLFGVTGPVFAAYDADGVPLGASEREVRKRYPGARCKALEWASKAAERRCDDVKAVFAGIEARITFYLRKDAVEAFDVRFDSQFAERIAGILTARYGKPVTEANEPVERGNQPARKIYKVLWENQAERALLTAPSDKRRASLVVSRGGFDEEIYRIR